MERRPQDIKRDPKTGGYPIIVEGPLRRKIVQTEPEPINKHRDPDWSIDKKGMRIVTTIIAIAFAVLVIGAVFS